ncbi:MAG: quinol monooxygenase YgiN [Kiritimatiellia bacterium]|jgi:quinol monooxygenase YgiN
MAIHVSLELTIQPGKATEFIGLCAEAFKVTRTKPGFVDIVATQGAEDPNQIVFWETWETVEQYDAYFAWRVETGFMDAIGPFMAAPPVKTVLNPVA